jgi:hypothetical protein
MARKFECDIEAIFEKVSRSVLNISFELISGDVL